MAPNSKVFGIGPGLIEGEVIDILIKEGYDITTIVRRQAAMASIDTIGVKTILGDLGNKELISKSFSQNDVVFHRATADHLPSVEAVLDGVRKRAESGQSTRYVHTNGASLLGDESSGDFKGTMIYHDVKPQDIDVLPDKPGRDWGRKTKLVIMIPPLIYGVNFREQRLSIQLPTLIRYALKHGFAGHVGKGLSVWSQVHVKDLAQAYVILLHWLEGGDFDEIFTNSYVFCENSEELSWRECDTEIGRALYKAGQLQSPQAKTVPEDSYDDIFGSFTGVVAWSNSRSRANRLRKLGWQPQEVQAVALLYEDQMSMILTEKDEFHAYSKAVAS